MAIARLRGRRLGSQITPLLLQLQDPIRVRRQARGLACTGCIALLRPVPGDFHEHAKGLPANDVACHDSALWQRRDRFHSPRGCPFTAAIAFR
jgi:hypothetical protein